jgi:hypothetical protein
MLSNKFWILPPPPPPPSVSIPSALHTFHVPHTCMLYNLIKWQRRWSNTLRKTSHFSNCSNRLVLHVPAVVSHNKLNCLFYLAELEADKKHHKVPCSYLAAQQRAHTAGGVIWWAYWNYVQSQLHANIQSVPRSKHTPYQLQKDGKC